MSNMMWRQLLVQLVLLLSADSGLAWTTHYKLPNQLCSTTRVYEAAVEQVDLKSGEVVETFPSIKEAAKELNTYPAYIRLVLDGERRSSEGFFWRQKGSDVLPPSKPGVPVEKLSLDSEEVLETFDRASDAGCSIGILLRVESLPRAAGGFFWRQKGSTDKPSTTPRGKKRKATTRPVEKICLDTNTVLETFPSTYLAANSVSTHAMNVYSVLRGNTFTCRGFFWRYAGSNALPRSKNFVSRGRQWTDNVKPVEQVCPQTNNVIATYDSVQEAAVSLGGASYLILRSIRGEIKSSAGYFWRWQGSDALPPKSNPSVNDFAVEQVSLDTGEVVNSFKTLADAVVHTGIKKQGIRSVLNGKQVSSGRHFWRRQGTDDLPPQLTKKVEQVSLETWKAMNTFNSIADAARGTGSPKEGIRDVLKGKQFSTNGFFWRYEGSEDLPRKRTRKVEQLSLETGEVVNTFNSANDAAHQTESSYQRIYHVLRGTQSSYAGHYWRYEGSGDLPPQLTKKSSA